MSNTEVGYDHSYLYVNQKKFFPIIREGDADFEALDSVNGVMISIDALQEEFNWHFFYEQAEEVVALGKYIVWDLDFHFRNKSIFIEDSSCFFSFSLVIEEFVTNLLEPFKDKTLGVFLFKGDVDFQKYFVWTERHEQYYLEKAQDFPSLKKEKGLDVFFRKVFAADVFSEYLHRLASFLPDTVLPFCLIDVTGEEGTAALAAILSKDRFQHLLLALKGAKVSLGHLNWQEGNCLGGWIGKGDPYFSTVSEILTAVCLPTLDHLNEEVLAILDKTFTELSNFNIPFRIIDENRLHECWDGIDDLIVVGSSIGEQGIRKLRGFAAAGGRIVTVGCSLHFENEISLQDLTKNLQAAEVLF